MKSLVFAFDVDKLSDSQLHHFMDGLMDAQRGYPLGLCKFSVFEHHGTMSIVTKLDELRGDDGIEKGMLRERADVQQLLASARIIRDDDHAMTYVQQFAQELINLLESM